VRRVALISLAAAVYAVAAWMVAPGFYDGFGPRAPYNWTCPPPQAGANIKPSSGHAVIQVINGASDANSAFTDDGQIVIGFLPGAFDVTGNTSIVVDITPLATCPQPAGIQFVTNVYQIKSTAPLLKSSNLVLLFSALEVAPTDVYFADDPAGPWKSIGASPQSQPYTIDTKTSSFGYFGFQQAGHDAWIRQSAAPDHRCRAHRRRGAGRASSRRAQAPPGGRRGRRGRAGRRRRRGRRVAGYSYLTASKRVPHLRQRY
jgi:hypothetical protein